MYSQAVTHPSTNMTQCCLTSVIRRELVFSTWYGRRRYMKGKFWFVYNWSLCPSPHWSSFSGCSHPHWSSSSGCSRPHLSSFSGVVWSFSPHRSSCGISCSCWSSRGSSHLISKFWWCWEWSRGSCSRWSHGSLEGSSPSIISSFSDVRLYSDFSLAAAIFDM